MRDPLYWVPIKYKLGLTFILLALLSLGTGGYVAYQTARDALQEKILETIDLSTADRIGRLSAYVDQLKKRTEDFSSDGFIRDSVRDLQAGRSSILRRQLNRHLLKNKVGIVPDFFETLVAGEEGIVLASSLPENVGVNLSRSSYIVEGRRKLYLGDVHLVDDEGSPGSLDIAAPLTDRVTGAFIGVIVNRVKPEYLSVALAGDEPVEGLGGADYFLIDDSDVMLAAARHRERKDALLKKAARVPWSASGPGGGAVGSGVRTGMVTGTEVFSAWGNVPQTKWTLVSEIETRRAFQPVRVLRDRLMLVGIVLALLTAVLLFFPSKFMIGPIVRLRDAAHRIEQGDYNVSVSLNSKDEIGQLANAFNRMANGLKQRVELESRLFQYEKMMVLGQLSAGVAHELGTPLASIGMFSQILNEEEGLTPEARDHATVILRNARSCEKTIRALLGYAGRRIVEPANFDLRDCLEDALELCGPLLGRSRIRLNVDPAPRSAPCFGDREGLKQVFVNLTMNAIQAMEEGGILSIHNENRDGRGGRRNVVKFQDTGKGIDPRHLDRIFEPFFTTKPEGMGTGLGLSISRRIVEEHGGTIEVTTGDGGGASFIVSLPLRSEQQTVG